MKKLAFTLVELLVVISIIAILTAVLLPNFMGARERAADSNKKQEMMAIKNTLRLYFNDNQSYPSLALLNSILPDHLESGASGIGYTYGYVQTLAGDGFNLYVGTEATSLDEKYESQRRCGISPLNDIYYYVCAN